MNVPDSDNVMVGLSSSFKSNLSGHHTTDRLAHPNFVYGYASVNCGEAPPGFLPTYWRCTTLDNGNPNTREADYVSLAVNSRGLVSIAYSEDEIDEPVTSIKFIYQVNQTFLPLLTKQ